MASDDRLDRGMKAQLGERRRAVARGDQPLGWKLGFGTEKAMSGLKISAPLVGYLLVGARLESGATCDVSAWVNPRLEPELAVFLTSDLPASASRKKAEAAIGGLGAAIELVDPDPSADDPEAILEGDIFQRHVLLGPSRQASIADVRLRVVTNGEEVAASSDVTELTGDPVELVLHVANTLEAAGEGLTAGAVVICGSIVPALEVAAGDEVEVELDPLGALVVRFA